MDPKERGRRKFRYRHSYKKPGRQRSSSPPIGNHIKGGCSWCHPTWSIRVEKKEWLKNLILNYKDIDIL